MANAQTMGKLLLERLGDIAAAHKTIGSPRGLGLMCGADVINPATGRGDAKLRERILQAAYDRGLILLGCGEVAIRFCPPLCITSDELETGLAIFDDAVASVA